MNTLQFNTLLQEYYSLNKRILPWRERIDPYYVVITEIMLQQTQVPRVLVKFPEFIKSFPNFQSLAQASSSDLLTVWQGMGYNRRAKYLREISLIITEKYKGVVPINPDELDAMPGIGFATARSIVTFIYNKPEIFIETNIRRVFIHHFFEDNREVADSEIYPLVEKALDKQNPREWYYAIMDYGTALGKVAENPNRRSKHYAKQSKFEGSKRQIRGGIIRELLKGERSGGELAEELGFDLVRVEEVIGDLKGEGFISEKKRIYKIK